MISDREQAVFEAGIKLGALYHQWVGTPISRATASSVETAIEQAVGLQPYVTAIRVRLNRDLMTANPYGYSELTGAMFSVEITTVYGKARCVATLDYTGAYPLMSIRSIDETP
ncbi:dihydroneopterin aldolase family protein [uncultured Methanofollis sp.]|uniref:dihydroneopterin aldolase family protein n=1 Tax=uncultured Methanofollis sp. TaxID=262500 RepID=UPI002620D7C6|nr:dihydroneopterin aldolase family protein [uncultured Methanofollis sp.]